ncbi:MAG: hypothetical protein WAL34_03970 [Acidobacteriaceae bacterium]
MHYQRVKKFGDPTIVKKVPSPALDWIEANKNHIGDDCLRWPFHIGKDGYGRVHYRAGPLTTASRLMCTTAHGEPPSKKHEAAHSCGKGDQGCVNPNHIYWATSARNHADKIVHGTTNRGERQGRSRLTEADVLEIRQMLGLRTQKEIAHAFGVDESHIAHIKRGKAWGWLKTA